MIKRIVRMAFLPEKVSDFLAIFDNSKQKIAEFDGCYSLSLYKDLHDDNVYYTISLWESEAHLDAYRKSELFKNTWQKTKVLFSEKPIAFSISLVDKVK